MSPVKLASALFAGLLVLPPAAVGGFLEATVDSEDTLLVFFEAAVRADSVKVDNVSCFAFRGGDDPTLVRLSPRSAGPAQGEDEVFELVFANRPDGTGAFSDQKAQYTLRIKGVKSSSGEDLGTQNAKFMRHPPP